MIHSHHLFRTENKGLGDQKSLRVIRIPLLIILFISSICSTNAQTAVLFGASGQVGSEVYRSLVLSPFWKEVVTVGRRFPEKLDDFRPKGNDGDGSSLSLPNVTKISLPDLANIDKNENLRQRKADACFIALGVPNPQELTLDYWHSIEIDMIASISRLCNQMQVKTISLLSAIDAEEEPEPFTSAELREGRENVLGWIGMVSIYARMKGLEERATITASEGVPFIRLFHASTIVTDEYRYGLVDRFLFQAHKILDYVIPTKYHSVPVKLLGMAMADDAAEILNSTTSNDSVPRIARLTYKDYSRISGQNFQKLTKETSTIKEEM